MSPARTFGELLAAHLVATVEADGTFVRTMAPDIRVDTATRTWVEARFGATDLLAGFRGAARPAMRAGTILIKIDETRVRSPRATTDLGSVVAYKYDLIDEPYGSEIGFHRHIEANGHEIEIHQHERVNGGERQRYPNKRLPAPQKSVTLDQALTVFRGRMWANRYPAPIAPKSR